MPNKSPFFVEVFAYKNFVIFAPSTPEEGKQWWPTTDDGRMGCVVGDSKKALRISQEALDLLNRIPAGRDCIGDIDWFKCDNNQYAFSWFGGIYRVIDTRDMGVCGARDYRIHPEQCTVIPNNPTKEMIAGAKKAAETMWTWKSPFSVKRSKKQS